MSYGRVVISSGHGSLVRGASGIIDEVDEARKVVEQLAKELDYLGVEVKTFHDDTSTSQSQNLETIVDYHNEQSRDLDISVHFNAYVETEKGMGTEVLYISQSTLAARVAEAIAECGLINRGGKKRTDLYFLNNTDRPAILIEVCFVDSETDCSVYDVEFNAICQAIAGALADAEGDEEERPDVLTGEVSWFGGPDDDGVDPDEDLAFIYSVEDAPYLFLATQPEGTTGLARRLNPNVPYIALRFDYDVHPKDTLVGAMALVRATKTGRQMIAFAADWGPHIDTGRIADISPGLMTYLGIETDDEVEVIFPYTRGEPI
jgi:N-acetylmuramoyl-L-alanine amidase